MDTDLKELTGWIIISQFIISMTVFTLVDIYLNLSKLDVIKKISSRINSKVVPTI